MSAQKIPGDVKAIAAREASAFKWAARAFVEYEGDMEADIAESIEAAVMADRSARQEGILDEATLRARIGKIGDEIHEFACHHQEDQALSQKLGDLRNELWRIARLASPAVPDALPDDVVAIVIAARNVIFEQPQEAIDALDKAVEAFSTRVPYEDEL